MNVHAVSGDTSKSLEYDLIVSKVDVLDLDGSSTSLTGIVLAVILFAFSFHAHCFVLDDSTRVGGLCLDFGTFQFSNPGLRVG